MGFLLSICIPTYNRVEYLKFNIDILLNIVGEHGNKIEICVSDNASTDGTEELIDNYIQSLQSVSFVYKKNKTNVGPDWNFHNVMNMASGEYSLLLGDDDYLTESAIKRIIDVIESELDFGILLFNRIIVSVNTTTIKNQSWLRDDIDSRIFDFNNSVEEKYYYTLCRSLGGIFSFISSMVYKTEAVSTIRFDESYIGSSYSFLHYLLNYLKSGKKLFFLNEYLVNCRIGLPSFGSGYKRILLDINGFLFLKNKMFTGNEGIEFINVLKYEWPINKMLETYCNTGINEWDENIKPLLLEIGWTRDEISFIEKIGNSPNWYNSKFKQKLKKVLGR